jgi:hypothetical protein
MKERRGPRFGSLVLIVLALKRKHSSEAITCEGSSARIRGNSSTGVLSRNQASDELQVTAHIGIH